MRIADHHVYQILTKRADRLLELSEHLSWKDHIWMGVTVEDEHSMSRIDQLRRTNAKIKFLSLEPLLGSLGKLNLTNIDWVIVGGESGPKARPVKPVWIRSMRDQCLEQGVPFFFKQWGGVRKKENGRELDGCTWSQMPKKELMSV